MHPVVITSDNDEYGARRDRDNAIIENALQELKTKATCPPGSMPDEIQQEAKEVITQALEAYYKKFTISAEEAGKNFPNAEIDAKKVSFDDVYNFIDTLVEGVSEFYAVTQRSDANCSVTPSSIGDYDIPKEYYIADGKATYTGMLVGASSVNQNSDERQNLLSIYSSTKSDSKPHGFRDQAMKDVYRGYILQTLVESLHTIRNPDRTNDYTYLPVELYGRLIRKYPDFPFSIELGLENGEVSMPDKYIQRGDPGVLDVINFALLRFNNQNRELGANHRLMEEGCIEPIGKIKSPSEIIAQAIKNIEVKCSPIPTSSTTTPVDTTPVDTTPAPSQDDIASDIKTPAPVDTTPAPSQDDIASDIKTPAPVDTTPVDTTPAPSQDDIASDIKTPVPDDTTKTSQSGTYRDILIGAVSIFVFCSIVASCKETNRRQNPNNNGVELNLRAAPGQQAQINNESSAGDNIPNPAASRASARNSGNNMMSRRSSAPL